LRATKHKYIRKTLQEACDHKMQLLKLKRVHQYINPHQYIKAVYGIKEVFKK